MSPLFDRATVPASDAGRLAALRAEGYVAHASSMGADGGRVVHLQRPHRAEAATAPAEPAAPAATESASDPSEAPAEAPAEVPAAASARRSRTKEPRS